MKLGLGNPAPALIMSVTLDCAAAQWIPTRLANATDETSGELDLRPQLLISLSCYITHSQLTRPRFGKGWDSNVDGVENVPVVLRSNPFEPNDNDLSDSAIARFMELNCLEEVAAQFISAVGLSTGTQSYRKNNGEFRIPDHLCTTFL